MEFNTIKKTVLELSPKETECLNQAYLIINDMCEKMVSEGYKAVTDWDYTNIGVYDLDIASDILKDLAERDGLELHQARLSAGRQLLCRPENFTTFSTKKSRANLTFFNENSYIPKCKYFHAVLNF